MDKLVSAIKKFDKKEPYTGQIYGLAYLLIENPKALSNLRNYAVDRILESAKSIGKHVCIVEGGNVNNYYISHHYNFAVNLLVIVAIQRLVKVGAYRLAELEKLKLKLIAFLEAEQTFLDDYSKKTVGFELITGKFLEEISEFSGGKLSRKYSELREKRLANTSKVLLFSPEGLDDNLKLEDGFREQVIKGANTEVFAFNSPELTIKMADELDQNNSELVSALTNKVTSLQGVPPFFESDRFFFPLAIEVLRTTGLLEISKVRDASLDQVKRLELFGGHPGDYHPQKGFSIAKGFELYDLDTSSMLMKALYSLGLWGAKEERFAWSYYSSDSDYRYSTYKKDNRFSPSVLAHLLSAQCLVDGIEGDLLKVIFKIIDDGLYSDKYNASTLYVQYSLLVGLIDSQVSGFDCMKYIDRLVASILSAKKETGLFTTFAGLSTGTVEETTWAALALNYYRMKIDNSHIRINESIQSIKNVMKTQNTARVEELERLWIFKQIYTPITFNQLLFAVIDQLEIQ